MDPTGVVQRLAQAMNDHDLDALVDCFAVDYRNETPVHPARGFVGAEQVRRNWAQILGGVPDLRADIVRSAAIARTVWTEWEMSGRRRDGDAFLMRGVVIVEVDKDRMTAARFYLEPVDHGAADADAAVREHVGTAS